MTKTITTTWIDIFRHDATKQVIYLAVFIGLILKVYFSFDGMLSSKFASCLALEKTNNDIVVLRGSTSEKFIDINTRMDKMDKKLDRILDKIVKW